MTTSTRIADLYRRKGETDGAWLVRLWKIDPATLGTQERLLRSAFIAELEGDVRKAEAKEP